MSTYGYYKRYYLQLFSDYVVSPRITWSVLGGCVLYSFIHKTCDRRMWQHRAESQQTAKTEQRTATIETSKKGTATASTQVT